MKFIIKNKIYILLAIAIFMGCLAHPEYKDTVLFVLNTVLMVMPAKRKDEAAILEALISVLESW